MFQEEKVYQQHYLYIFQPFVPECHHLDSSIFEKLYHPLPPGLKIKF